MPRYVVLEHAGHGARHWDLMLESGDALATWALERPPEAGVPVAAKALPDHRVAYLEYEGPISGDRGTVVRWDAGEYRLLSRSDVEWIALLNGGSLVGRMRLTRSADVPEQWTFHFTAE